MAVDFIGGPARTATASAYFYIRRQAPELGLDAEEKRVFNRAVAAEIVTTRHVPHRCSPRC